MRRIATYALACLGVLAGGEAQAQVLTTQSVPTAIVGADGIFVWSRLNPRDGDYRLVMTKGAETTRLRVPARESPFDVQLGRGRDGRLVAVYSRCARDRGDWSNPFKTARQCRLWAYDFRSGDERPLNVVTPKKVTSMFLPAIAGRRIAYAARRTDGEIALYMGKLGATPARRLALPRPGGDDPHRGLASRDYAGPTRLSLRGRRLAYTWEYAAQRPECGSDSRVGALPNSMLVVATSSRPGRVVAHGHCPEDGTTYDVREVSWAGPSALRYLATVGGSAEGAIRKLDLRSGATTEWAAGPEYGSRRDISGYAVAGRAVALGQIGDAIQTLPVLPDPTG